MGPLDGVRVVELANDHVAWAGKLFADLGADVIVVEPPGGSAQRGYAPFYEDHAGTERSLWWWHYHTSKRSIVADLDIAADVQRLSALVGDADVLLEGEPPGRLQASGLDWASVHASAPRLILASVTPFGSSSPRSHEPFTDLTALAEGGPVWSCGYDDHSLPPVRGGGNQAWQTTGSWAVIALLVALLEREESGRGQHVDVSINAATNVTTEMATYGWLMCEWEVQRQTGRHATPNPSPPTQVLCADGRYATTGVLPRSIPEFEALVGLLDRLGYRDEFPSMAVLDLATERESISMADVQVDPLVAEIFGAAREALLFLAERLDAYRFFTETQGIGQATGIVYSPGEAIADPHFVERGFPVEIEHPELGRSFTYPGAPYRFTATPWSARRAPLVGEHDAEVAEQGWPQR